MFHLLYSTYILDLSILSPEKKKQDRNEEKNTYLEERGKAPDEGVNLGLGVKPVRGSGRGLLVLSKLGVDLLHGGGQSLRLLRGLQLDHLEGHQEGLDR